MKNATKDHTSYTGLSAIDGWLRHVPPFFGNEAFLVLGRAVHRAWLEGKEPETVLTDKQKLQLKGMTLALSKSKEAMKLHRGSHKEREFHSNLEIPNFGIKIRVFMDILCKKSVYGADLKTTNSTSHKKFIEAAKAFGYFGQGYIYKQVSGVKDFYIISVQKEPPHNVYVLNVSDYHKEELKAKEKIDFLAYVFKNHRKDIDL